MRRRIHKRRPLPYPSQGFSQYSLSQNSSSTTAHPLLHSSTRSNPLAATFAFSLWMNFALSAPRASDASKSAAQSRVPTKDDTACIMYTSGSTGAPKGVILTHLNLISALGSIYEHVVGRISQRRIDTYLSSHLSHILAYIVDLALFFAGVTIGYGRVRTLVDSGVRNCQGDMKEFKPTAMIGVPAIWETIRKGNRWQSSF